jgi:hypothetical protein
MPSAGELAVFCRPVVTAPAAPRVHVGGHVVARVKAGISLPAEPGGGWRPDGSCLTWLNAPSGKKQDRLAVRAAEHNAVLPGGDGEEVSETCTRRQHGNRLKDRHRTPASLTPRNHSNT